MKVNLDENGYIKEWAIIGDNGGIDVPEPEDLTSFMECASGYKIVDGKLVKDAAKDRSERLERQKETLRHLRENECFPIINRGWMWYSGLNLLQWLELKRWYIAWLNVTDTLSVPEKPKWLDDFDVSSIPDKPLWL